MPVPMPCDWCGKPGCPTCRLATTNPQYQKLWGPRRPVPCVHLGVLVERAPCVCPRKDTRRCDAGRGDVTQARECELCPGYEADCDSLPGSPAD